MKRVHLYLCIKISMLAIILCLMLTVMLIASLVSEPKRLSTSSPHTSQLSVTSTLQEDYRHITPLLKEIIAIETWRRPDRSNEATVLANLEKIQQLLWKDLQQFNKQQEHIKFTQRQWKKTIDAKDYWVYAYRIGHGDNLTSIIAHLDTVAAYDNSWEPFTLREEKRAYASEKTQTFLVGRGSIDNKGPAIFALDALKIIAKQYDNIGTGLTNSSLEVLFDTSEESGASVAKYFQNCPRCIPQLGIVFDSKWCIRAEKGIERPHFYVNVSPLDKTGISITDINTFDNPINQIPDKVTVTFTSADANKLQQLKSTITDQYIHAQFDDHDYRKADMHVQETNENKQSFIIEFLVAGAQHGSVPDINRLSGANPLVSALNFINQLSKNDSPITENAYTDIAKFVSWAWGTHVLGQHHAILQSKDDGIFTPGTTYAITKIEKLRHDNGLTLKLGLDIRYAIDHHDRPWSGKDGSLEGHSKFPVIFSELTQEYTQKFSSDIQFNTHTIYPPDIRNPNNPAFKKINRAFKHITGESCPMHAIGGGTDARGQPNLIAAGPLFKTVMNYPVNYHSINEAAPVKDLLLSRNILVEILKQEINRIN